MVMYFSLPWRTNPTLGHTGLSVASCDVLVAVFSAEAVYGSHSYDTELTHSITTPQLHLMLGSDYTNSA